MPRTLDHRGSRSAYGVQGQGPPVLLIQGVGVHGEGWRPGASHGVPIQFPDRINSLLLDHLAAAELEQRASPKVS